jgi:signal transduction histidine kinase
MKNINLSSLYFVLIISALFSFCTTKVATSNETSKLDSIDFFIKKMKNNKLNTNERLISANRALEIIENSNTDKRVITILRKKIYLLGVARNYKSALQTSKKLLLLSIKHKDSALIADESFRVGYYYLLDSKKDSAFFYYQLANNIYNTLNDSIKIGQSLAQMAMIQSDYGDYIDSDKNAINAITYLKKDDKVYLPAIYNCLAISSKGQFDYAEAVYWYNRAIEILPSSIEKITCLNNKANSLRYMKEFEKSYVIFENILKDSTIENYPKTKARVIDNLAYTKWLAKKKENVLADLEKALEIRLEESDLWGLIASYAHLSKYYENVNPKTALSYALKMYDVSTLQKSTPDQLEALQKLIALDDSKKAKRYYINYMRISDSLKNAEKTAKNQFAKIKYDSEKNREENLQLRISTTKKELALEKEKTRNIIGAVSSGSIVIGLLIFVYYRKQKHQQEKREEVYNTETRIAKKIHDEVANNVVNIMNKMQYTNEPKDQLLDDLENVYLLTRNISHQNNTIETGEKFEHFLKTMLTSFNSNTTTIIVKDIHTTELAEISPDKQIELYRVLQELMVNMRKHSEAKLVAITFKHNQNHFYINYSDNGIGLDMKDLNFKNGLSNVETRIKSINGTITFETSLNNGFKAFISFKK